MMSWQELDVSGIVSVFVVMEIACVKMCTGAGGGLGIVQGEGKVG